MDEILEAAAVDSELWVSMLAETMKTFPATGSLNTDLTNYDVSHKIFIDMVNDLKKVVNKTNDLGMLPLECQYLNKTALTALVGIRPEPTKHFIVKRKPKSFYLRQELIQKSMDAQSSLKKISAPTVPLRSRGIPRKMTDTTPMKGIPSRVPTGGFRSPPTTSQGNNRPSVSRTPAGRKDGGIKLLEIEDQPLGYAAAKKRKRQQELEEQQKRALESQATAATVESTGNATPTTATVTSTTAGTPTTPTTPDYAAGLQATTVFSQPATPMPSTSEKQVEIVPVTTIAAATTTSSISTTASYENVAVTVTNSLKHVVNSNNLKKEQEISPKRVKLDHSVSVAEEAPKKVEVVKSNHQTPMQAVSLPQQTITVTREIKTEMKSPTVVQPQIKRTLPTLITSTAVPKSQIMLTPTTTIAGQSYVTIKAVSTPMAGTSGTTTFSNLSNLNIPSTTKIVRTVQYVSQAPLTSTTQKSPATILTSKPTLSLTKTVNAGQHQQISKPTILSNIVLTPQQTTSTSQAPTSYTVINSPSAGGKIVQRVVSGQNINIPQLTRPTQQTINQSVQLNQQTPTKIVQIQTTPGMLNQNSMKNIPPLISTQQPTTLLNFQNIQNIQNQGRKVTITQQSAQNNPNIQRITLSQAQAAVQQQQQSQQQQNQQAHQTQQQSHVITSANPQKITQVMMPSNVKGKTIILTNPNLLTQKNSVILQSVGPGGNSVYQQIPIQNVSGLTGLRGATIVTNPPGLIKTTGNDQQKTNNQQIPALVPTSNLSTQNIPGLTPVVIATSNQQQNQSLPTLITKMSTGQPNQVQIRPVLTTMQQPQLTLIQRPGQQPQLVQTIQPQQQTIQTRTYITQQPQQQTVQIQQQQPTTQVVQQQTSQSSGTAATVQLNQRKGLSLSVSLTNFLHFIYF